MINNLKSDIKNNKDGVVHFIGLGMNVNSVNNNGQTALHITCTNWPEINLPFIIQAANVNTIDQDNNTPLHLLSMGHSEISVVLIENNANINAIDEENRTPLHLACEYEPEIAKVLIKNNADLTLIDNKQRTPLLVACQYHPELAKVLLKKDHSYQNHNALLYTAKKYKNYDLLAFLQKDNIEKINIKGETPLIEACHKKNEKLIFSLLEYGADMNFKNNRGESALLVLQRKRILSNKLKSLMESELLMGKIESTESNVLSL